MVLKLWNSICLLTIIHFIDIKTEELEENIFSKTIHEFTQLTVLICVTESAQFVEIKLTK